MFFVAFSLFIACMVSLAYSVYLGLINALNYQAASTWEQAIHLITPQWTFLILAAIFALLFVGILSQLQENY